MKICKIILMGYMINLFIKIIKLLILKFVLYFKTYYIYSLIDTTMHHMNINTYKNDCLYLVFYIVYY